MIVKLSSLVFKVTDGPLCSILLNPRAGKGYLLCSLREKSASLAKVSGKLHLKTHGCALLRVQMKHAMLFRFM